MSNKKPFIEYDRQYFGEQVLMSKVRPATDAEVEMAKAHYKATKKCDHSVVVDEPGWLYDCRSCFVCGQGLGLI